MLDIINAISDSGVHKCWASGCQCD